MKNLFLRTQTMQQVLSYYYSYLMVSTVQYSSTIYNRAKSYISYCTNVYEHTSMGCLTMQTVARNRFCGVHSGTKHTPGKAI